VDERLRFVSKHGCAYVSQQQAEMEYSVVPKLSGTQYERLMDRGYRKFGCTLFRPICAECRKCRPIRVDAHAYRPDRSQRRNLRENAGLRINVGPSIVDEPRVALYNRYHEARTQQKAWPATVIDATDYDTTFLANPLPNAELSLWRGEALLAVVLLDITPRAFSAIYHYYEPSEAGRGLGTFALQQAILLARERGKRWAYLGYYVEGCGSMEYKSRFRPCEILQPGGDWRRLG
jgi:arginine-tRNA-protein transferase